jgi:hypothetical protein
LTKTLPHTYRVFLSLSILLLLASSLCSPAHAQRTVGVQVGDWAEYTVTGVFEGNITDSFENATDIFENVTSMRLTIVNIVETNVTIETSLYFVNGSSTAEPGWVDVDTGNGTYSGWLIAANLNAGDRVYTDNETMFSELTINETTTREYLGSMVEVNHFIINVTTPSNPFYNLTMLMDWYWSRDSGMMTEMHMYMLTEGLGDMTLVDVNVHLADVIPEFRSSAYLPVFLITTVAAAVLLLKLKSKALANS